MKEISYFFHLSFVFDLGDEKRKRKVPRRDQNTGLFSGLRYILASTQEF
jgi:hypothetical protein